MHNHGNNWLADWFAFQSGKLRQFKYGKRKKSATATTAAGGRAEGGQAGGGAPLQPHAPAGPRSKVDMSEKENLHTKHSRPRTPPPPPKKVTHEMSISTSPIPIEESDLTTREEEEVRPMRIVGPPTTRFPFPSLAYLCVFEDSPMLTP